MAEGCQKYLKELTATGIAQDFHLIPYYGYPEKGKSPPKRVQITNKFFIQIISQNIFAF